MLFGVLFLFNDYFPVLSIGIILLMLADWFYLDRYQEDEAIVTLPERGSKDDTSEIEEMELRKKELVLKGAVSFIKMADNIEKNRIKEYHWWMSTMRAHEQGDRKGFEALITEKIVSTRKSLKDSEESRYVIEYHEEKKKKGQDEIEDEKVLTNLRKMNEENVKAANDHIILLEKILAGDDALFLLEFEKVQQYNNPTKIKEDTKKMKEHVFEQSQKYGISRKELGL
jgi:hypothetical protein